MTHTSLTNSTCCLKLAIWTSSWYYFLLKLPYCSSFHFSNTSLYDSTTIRSKHIITLILDITNSRLYVTFIPVIITLLHYPFCIIGIDWNSRTCIYGIIYGISLDPPEKLQSPWSMCSNWWHKHQSQSSATFLPTFSHTHPPATPIPGKRTVVMFQLTVAKPLVDIFNWQINGQMKKKIFFFFCNTCDLLFKLLERMMPRWSRNMLFSTCGWLERCIPEETNWRCCLRSSTIWWSKRSNRATQWGQSLENSVTATTLMRKCP